MISNVMSPMAGTVMKMMPVGKREGMRENCLLQFCPASAQVLVTEDHLGCYISRACRILIRGCASFLVLSSAKFSVLISFSFSSLLFQDQNSPEREIIDLQARVFPMQAAACRSCVSQKCGPHNALGHRSWVSQRCSPWSTSGHI